METSVQFINVRIATSFQIQIQFNSNPRETNGRQTLAKDDRNEPILITPSCFGFSIRVSQGLQSRDRHLFLFNDLLLIAKARSGGHFKLKDKVRISELWLSTGIEEVAEGSAGKSRDTSFVIGWPPSVNLVATFRYT